MEDSKKVLVITYYWPPSGGSGVQRWLKFVKYLDRAGWAAYVLTPENPSFTMKDPSLLKDIPPGVEVLKLPIWEPYGIFHQLSSWFGKKNSAQTDFVAEGKKSFFQRLTSWIRGNMFIPDARIFWVKPATNFIQQIIHSNHIDKIITTGPPHSIHLIGLKLKKRNPDLKWIADFRDPWSEWDLLDTLSLSSWARSRHRALEKKVLHSADRVITIAPYYVQRFESLSGRKVDLITNGFDPEDFSAIERQPTTRFTIRHIGVVDELRDPRPFMRAVRRLCESDAAFKTDVRIEFIGSVNSKFKNEIIDDAVLGQVTGFIPHLPHDQLVKIYGATNVVLLVLAHTTLAPGNLPGKFFEYLASGNPILAVGPTAGDVADILKTTGAGEIAERSDAQGIQASLLKAYSKWKSGASGENGDIDIFSRKQLTTQLISILESL